MSGVAVLGTGKMGSAIARRLAEVDSDLQLTLWNRTLERAARVGVGRVAATPADAARDADVVISSLTGPDAIRSTYLGADGALAAAARRASEGTVGPLFVEMSTAGPAIVAELAPRVAAAGARLVDAPVLGAPIQVASGSVTVLLGGDPADVERARQLLVALGEVRHVGGLGDAARLKLVSNSFLAALTAAAAELQTAGSAVGLDPEDVFWALARLAPVLELRRAGYLEDRHAPAHFDIRDLRKDVDLALEMLRARELPAPLTALTRELVAEAARDWPGLDTSVVIRSYAPRAQISTEGAD